MLCTKTAIDIMKMNGGGKILNTSSIRAWEHGGGPSLINVSSKDAINSFTRTLAKMVASDNIQVNAVSPGFVRTRGYNSMSKELLKSFIDQTYLKRWVKEEEIADTFLYF